MRAAATWARTEFRGRWRGLVAVALLVGLMAAVAMTAVAGARRTSTSYDRFRQSALAHDVFTFVDDATRPTLDRVGRLPSVAAYETGSLYPAFIDLESSYDIGIISPGGTRFGSVVNRGRYLDGRPPGPDSATEVALNERASEELDAGVGDVVTLGTFTPDQIATIESDFSGRLEGPTLRLRVTGVVRHPADLESDDANVLLFASPAFERAHHDTVGRFQAFGMYRLEGGTAAYPQFLREARPVLGTEGEVHLESSADAADTVNDALGAISSGLVLVAAAAAVVGVVAGGQALARQLSGAAPAQLVLAALGLTRRQRAAGLFLVALPVALGAGALALVGSLAASPLTPVSLGRQAEPDPGIRFDAVVHLGGAAATEALVLITAALVGAFTARRGLGVRPTPTRPTIATRLAGALPLGAPATTGVRMALEPGAGRAAVPVRSALVGAVVAVAGLVGAFTFGASLDRLVETPSRYGIPWDFQPDLFMDDELPRSVDSDAAAVGILSQASVDVEGRSATGYAIDTVKGRPSFQYLSGRAPRSTAEIALGRDLLDRVGARVGETVTVAAPEGPPRPLTVVGTVLSPGLDDDPLGSAAVLTRNGLTTVAQSDVKSVQAVIWWRDGVYPAAAQRRFEEAMPENVSIYAIPQPPAEVVNLRRVDTLPRFFAGFVGLVGVAALVHAVATSTRRRRSELAVLRTLGFLRRQLLAVTAWQASTIAAVGLLLGVPLGLAVGRWAWILVADGVGVATDPRIPLLAVGAVVPATLAAVNLLGLPLGARAAALRPAVALRTE
jgi:hypothetical protein